MKHYYWIQVAAISYIILQIILISFSIALENKILHTAIKRKFFKTLIQTISQTYTAHNLVEESNDETIINQHHHHTCIHCFDPTMIQVCPMSEK